MAHEVAHIINRDLWLMSLTDAMTNMTKLFSILGQGLVILLIPLYFFSDLQLPWVGVIILALSPLINSLLQLSFSRVREYNADLSAAYILGTGEYLANALEKLEYPSLSIFSRVFRTKTKEETPSLLRTHPPTLERVRRLRGLPIPKEIQPIDFSSSYYLRRTFRSNRLSNILNQLFKVL